jgi:hypothetical protein
MGRFGLDPARYGGGRGGGGSLACIGVRSARSLAHEVTA